MMQGTGPRIVQTPGSQQQAIVFTRPSQPNQIGGNVVTLPAGQMIRQSGLVGGQQLRVQNPQVPRSAMGATHVPAVAAGRNVIINQPGLRPGLPGSQITVPLTTLQAMQPGQGIPTGQAGHLLVKTETGQYQILRVGGSTGAGPTPSSSIQTTSLPTRPIPPASAMQIRPNSSTAAGMLGPTSLPQRPVVASVVSRTTTPSTPSTPLPSAASPSSAGGGMGQQQMTPDTAKLKCKNFLATLLRLANERTESVARNVRTLIQGLIDGKVDPEIFTTKLQRELNSSPQPCLVPFLKRSLPYLQRSLSSGELTIDGVRPPNSGGGLVQQVIRPGMATLPMRTMNAGQTGLNQGIMRTPVTNVLRPGGMGMMNKPIIPPPKMATLAGSMGGMGGMGGGVAPQIKKSSSAAFSGAGDDDINDVALMGGVNLAEESQRMQGATDLIGTQIRSCKDETFLQTGQLHRRIAKICQDRGLEEPSAEVIALMSHATQDRLKTLIEKLDVIAEHRMDIVKLEGEYEVTQDVKGQLRFLGDLDKLERRRHEEAEREMLLRAAKSRTKTEDPEKEKLKSKAKEMQRLEEEQLRHEKANMTALMAIGGPRMKKLRLDEQISGGSGKAPMPMRPRTKRVHARDLMFLMEQEKELKRSPLLWKSYCS